MSTEKKKQVAVALWIDDADFIDDNSEEALEYMLNMFEKMGIRTTFKIAGEKIRMLKKHNRWDLIKALGRHELCYHTQYHTFHPTIIQFTEPLRFSEGAAEFEKREIQGLIELRDTVGRKVEGYGQPGEAWSADVCPVLLKYGADIMLDDHFIINVNNQPFEYGGILNFNGISRIIRYNYQYGFEESLEHATAVFDDLAGKDLGWQYPEAVRLFSVFYHPGEFYMAEFMSDVYNFKNGKNIPRLINGEFKGLVMPPIVSKEEAHNRIDKVGQYLQHMLNSGARFVGVSDLRNMVIRRKEPICIDDIKSIACKYATGDIDFCDIGGEYISPSEVFVCLMQYLSNKPIDPFLVYGPEKREASHIVSSVNKKDIIAAMSDFDTVYGYRQLKSLYRVGSNLLTPLDLCATAAYMIAAGKEACPIVNGTLLTEQCVKGSACWDGRWMFAEKFDVSNTYEKTKLQCWTLKPIRI